MFYVIIDAFDTMQISILLFVYSIFDLKNSSENMMRLMSYELVLSLFSAV